MKLSKADKIIAEFMGKKLYRREFPPTYVDPDGVRRLTGKKGKKVPKKFKYSKSLDALVPVWEELSGNLVITIKENLVDWNVALSANYYRQGHKEETIQQAAAIATAKAILELKGK